MKISCLQENLAKGLSVVSRLVSSRGTLEILSHILLSTENGRLKLSATNLEIGVNYKVGGKVEEEGSVTVPARLFNELITQLPEGKINLETDKNNLLVKSSNYESKINGLSSDDFPLIPKNKNKKSFTISSSEFKDAINIVSFSSALDEARPVLAGVLFSIKKGKLTLAATDSYRLAEKVINISGGEKDTEAIVPTRSLLELSRVIGDSDREISVFIDENQIMFENDDFEFTSRLVEGKFPDYKQIIPIESETKAKVSVSNFLKIIKVAALFSGETAGSINLKVSSKGKINAESSSSQYGDSSASCEAVVEGKDIEIVFNSKYIIDVLNNLSGKDIEISFTDKLNPGVLKVSGDKSYVYVIMPLRA
ncbi:MAG: DNA polymerase III subunit beta [Patescibacteria group bacterium]|nr:DNA polymerase III subunit beta [Patescibacteria group bacterium]